MKMSFSLPSLFLGLCLTLPAATAAAQDEYEEDNGGAAPSGRLVKDGAQADRRFYFSGLLTGVYNDKDRELTTGYGGTLVLGKRITSGLNLELNGFYTTADIDFAASTFDGDPQTLTGFGIGAMVFLVQELPNLYAILAVQRGTGEVRAADFQYTSTVFDSGVGYLFPLTSSMFLRVEARYRMDQHNGKAVAEHDSYDGVLNAGIHIPLGTVALPAPPPVVVAPVDTDGDGISDDQDKCLGTPAGVAVDETGCEADTDGDGVVDRLDQCPDTPAGTAVNEVGCVGDADADGVPDDKDACPETPVGTAVNEVGCVGDGDGDGIPDDQDNCPESAPGAAVDETGCTPEPGCRPPKPGEPISLEGCATGESVVLKGVNFDSGSDRLTANARVILNGVADALLAKPEVKVEVGGHTDSQGADAYNQGLSEKRAKAVQAYLVSRGIEASRISSKGYGETRPIDTNETADGREANRRVEMKLVE